VRIDACEGRVEGICAFASAKRTPSRATRSSAGVRTLGLPYAPSRSERSVSIVKRTTLRGAGGDVLRAQPPANSGGERGEAGGGASHRRSIGRCHGSLNANVAAPKSRCIDAFRSSL
jgi:hypothetical protein